ncbi:hypothetical protein TDB9533_00063 [Thalassocella blandensis]|nr:hypothetical protein TDB9533_00063 [Thalassocella blandensis]
MRLPSSLTKLFTSGSKGAGGAGKAAGQAPKPAKQGSEEADAAMKKWLNIAKAGKYSTMAINMGIKYMEKGHGEANFMESPSESSGRPPGDNRSAEEIINDNPALKNLGNQKDIKRDELMKRCGDWTENNPDPKSRADAAYNMSKVLNYIDNTQDRQGNERQNSGDGNIEGITSDGDARHGTEAGMLKDFAEQGYGSLPETRQLDQTNDTHVRLDGSNKDNFQWGMGEMGKIFNKIPIIGGILGPVFEGFGEGRGLGDTLAKGFLGIAQGAFSAVTTFIGGPASIAATAAIDTAMITAETVTEQTTGKTITGSEVDHGGNIFT